jgi:hydrogenase-4 component F
MSYEVELVLLIPLVTAVLCILSPKEKAVSWICIIGSLLGVVATFSLCAPIFLDGTVVEYQLWYVDGLSALFLMVTSIVALMVSLYSQGYLRVEREENILTMRSEEHYYFCLNMFVAVMLAVFVVSSLGLLWIIIEATTLVSTFLVGFYRNEQSTEAAWKYLIICSVGITLALIGISLVYASTTGIITDGSSALNWPVLMSVASQLDPTLMKAAMVIIIVGFGTKVGFVPMHTWLPDAHSQAPTPVSALLSATLLNCAMYAILRFYIISEITIPGVAQVLLLLFGFLSLAIAAMFIIISKDIKRMLAYSSIENMGLIAIGFGIGTSESIFASLFLVVAHSLTKPILFFAAGNIIQQYGTKDMASIRGLKDKMPFTAFMLTIGSLAIIGMPVFAVFVGEIAMLIAMMSAGCWWMSIPFVILILMVFAGFGLHIFPMLGGDAERDAQDPKGILRAVPFVVLTGLIVFFGLFMPDQLMAGFESTVRIFGGGL